MRKLKLQMQITADGFVAGPEGQLDWMASDAMDERPLTFINHLIDTSDTILLGRKMTDGFVRYWEQVTTQADSPEYAFARKMVATPKVVFSKTLHHVAGKISALRPATWSKLSTNCNAKQGKTSSCTAVHRLCLR
jgi:dihydrofolate reductase